MKPSTTHFRLKVIAPLLAAVALLASISVAPAAELVTAEVTTVINDVTVTRGGATVTSNINVYAYDKLDNSITSANPSTAKVDTVYTLNGGVLSVGTPSSALKFYASSTCSGTQCEVTWDDPDLTTPGLQQYTVIASFSADAATPVGNYTINLSAASGTTQVTNPSGGSGGQLKDNNATFIIVHVVAPSDTTPPVITPNIAGTLGSNGWYVSDVTVSWTVSDPDSSITSSSGCGTTTISADTAETTLTCTATSAGGTSTQSVTIKRDATKPTVGVALNHGPDHNGWYNAAVGYTVTSNDAMSGIASCTPNGTYSGPDSSTAHVTSSCTDNAGNTDSATTANFQYDATAPTASASASPAANGNGWNNTDVTVSFSGSDGLSGIDSCSPPVVLSGDGAGQSASGTCTDLAGNSASATLTGINIDKTKPNISITTPTNTTYVLNAVVNAVYSCTDELSHIATCIGTVANGSPINTASIGAQTFTVNATDMADNTSNKSVTYNVGYRVCVLYDQTKSHKSGSTIPIKLQLCDVNGVNKSAANIVVTAYSLLKLDSTPDGTVEDSGNANPDSNFRYDATLAGYIFNLQTKGLTTGTYALSFKVDGQSAIYSVQFNIK